jgi:flagellar protein FlgJ
MDNGILPLNLPNLNLPKIQKETGFSLYQRNNDNVQLDQVAEEFEALFVTQMLKQAYQSKLADGIFDSSENETFQSMLNQELGRKFATNSNFGIADALKMQFKSNPK